MASAGIISGRPCVGSAADPFGPFDALPGGRADGRRPSDFDPRQLKIGTRVELEHALDPRIAREIAMDHLTEDPMYYDKLAQVHLDGTGLGLTRARWIGQPSGLGLTRARWAQHPHLSQENVGQLEGITDFFESPAWRYRKWFILGGVGLLSLGALGLIGTLLK